MGRGCGTAGRVVASGTSGPRFESQHRPKKLSKDLSTVTSLKKTIIEKKRPV